VALYKVIKSPVVEGEMILAEDTSLGFHALGGAPGPYIKQFLQQNSPKHIDNIVDSLLDNRCVYKSVISAKYRSQGEVGLIVSPIRCEGRWRGGSNERSFESSFEYGNCRVGTCSNYVSMITGEKTSLIRIAVFWLMFRFAGRKPAVKIRK
jgi:inosine/xanthosine triphosphate pyrophosphatase family protein